MRLNGVDPDDFEAIVMYSRNRDISRSSGLPIAFGDDPAGREVICVYLLERDGVTVEPITAYDTGN